MQSPEHKSCDSAPMDLLRRVSTAHPGRNNPRQAPNRPPALLTDRSWGCSWEPSVLASALFRAPAQTPEQAGKGLLEANAWHMQNWRGQGLCHQSRAESQHSTSPLLCGTGAGSSELPFLTHKHTPRLLLTLGTATSPQGRLFPSHCCTEPYGCRTRMGLMAGTPH